MSEKLPLFPFLRFLLLFVYVNAASQALLHVGQGLARSCFDGLDDGQPHEDALLTTVVT